MHHRLQTVLRVPRRQRQQQVGRRHKARLDAGLCGFVAQRHRQVGLAHAARSNEHHVLVSLDEPSPASSSIWLRFTPLAKSELNCSRVLIAGKPARRVIVVCLRTVRPAISSRSGLQQALRSHLSDTAGGRSTHGGYSRCGSSPRFIAHIKLNSIGISGSYRVENMYHL